MKTFEFKGEVSSSKSYYNRALILSYYRKNLKIKGSSESRDVLFLQKAIQNLQSEMEVGEGGTTLRFLTFLVSRIPGRWTLKGSERLFKRPQVELQTILSYFGVQVDFFTDHLVIETKGWHEPTALVPLNLEKSTQFASGLLLNCWNLPFDMELILSVDRVSDGYLEMTLDLLNKAGLDLKIEGTRICVRSKKNVQINQIEVEPDLSSAFVVASLAAARGYCELENFPFESLQPDLCFLELFEKMNIPLERRKNSLIVNRTFDMKSVEISLKKAPDLFPVLAVLLTKSKGTSRIFDTPQLKYKESDRMVKTCELLKLMKVSFEATDQSITIHGQGRHHHEFFEFNPDQDHRLAFAGALAKAMGYRMRILNPQVVDKSFPGFWSLIGGGPG